MIGYGKYWGKEWFVVREQEIIQGVNHCCYEYVMPAIMNLISLHHLH